jgi:hypothetical protein
MTQQHWQGTIARTLCTAMLAVSSVTAQQEFATKQLGQAAVQFRDKAIHVVAAYYYSQRNHDSRWLLIQAGVSTTDEVVIKRDAIALRTPKGEVIPLATQRRVGEDTKQVEQLLQNASVQTHNVASYFKQPDRIEDMQLFRLAFGPVVHDSFIVDRDRAAVGLLFFEAPTGAWERGTYALVVRHRKGTAELPITLE